jgi:hypothetical protein
MAVNLYVAPETSAALTATSVGTAATAKRRRSSRFSKASVRRFRERAFRADGLSDPEDFRNILNSSNYERSAGYRPPNELVVPEAAPLASIYFDGNGGYVNVG